MTLSSIKTIYSVDGSCKNVTPAPSINGNWQGKSHVLRGKSPQCAISHHQYNLTNMYVCMANIQA